MPVETDEWQRVQASLSDAEKQVETALSVEQYQAVGLICREAVISLAQLVYSPEVHGTQDQTPPSETDAKRMLEAYIAIELAGGSNESLRRYAKAVLDLTNDLQHRRSASYADSALCLNATFALFSMIQIISGRRSQRFTSGIEPRFSYNVISRDSSEHLYELSVAVSNPSLRTIQTFRLDFSFPDLDTLPQRWRSISYEKPHGPLMEVLLKDASLVTLEKRRYQYCITFRSETQLLPKETMDLSPALQFRYRFTHAIYSNIEDLPPLDWTLYADGFVPKSGKVSIQELNQF